MLITGTSGFVGGNLAKYLLESGARVVGLDIRNPANSFLDYEGLTSATTCFTGDVCDRSLISNIIAKERIDVCFHLAAQVEVGVAMRHPYEVFESNIRGTYTLLEACRENRGRLQAIIVASSDKSYGSYPVTQMPYKEDYPLKAVFPYDVSKACADMIVQCFAGEIFQLPVVVTRFANIFGPGQLHFSALIPDVIRCALGYGEFVPRGTGKQKRDFLYIGDVVELYSVMAEKLASDGALRGQVFNAGTNRAHLVRDVVAQICLATGQPAVSAKIDTLWKLTPPVGEIDCQFMDFDKVNRHFNWQPRTSLEDGLAATIAWFKKYLSVFPDFK